MSAGMPPQPHFPNQPQTTLPTLGKARVRGGVNMGGIEMTEKVPLVRSHLRQNRRQHMKVGCKPISCRNFNVHECIIVIPQMISCYLSID